ncbi:MAG TPA: sulfur oxidation c-type cytochrome SoxX [Burkholderiales bacterium]|nr:sulfur oxidation c-type cytochrome SoxX [Burkholderiales bacterium]
MKRSVLWLSALVFASSPALLGQDDIAARAEAAFISSFAGGDAAVLARVAVQDEVQRACSEYRNSPPADVAQRLMSAQRAAIRYPAKLIGDWREGERIAEDFTGLRYSDKPGAPSGGNCYACHQVAPAGLAYGTVGPSLLGYGKLRGWGVAAQQFAYERIYNAHAFTACSAMPRFGHNGVLTPEQIAHLVALLLDPTSPVNR